MQRNAAALFLIIVSLSLFGCASSKVSEDVSSNIDMGRQNANNLYQGATEGNLANAYQNSTQATKGAIVGGAAGGITGAVAAPAFGFFPGALAGGILGASYGSYIDSNTSFEDKLENRGATMVVLGDNILIAIPSARLFDPMTATINPSAYSTLDLIAKYINSHTKILVKVAAYTNDLGSERVNLALSQQQAHAVARYLAASGINARLLYAVGYGGTQLVEKNSKIWEGSDNYRIEITLETLPV